MIKSNLFGWSDGPNLNTRVSNDYYIIISKPIMAESNFTVCMQVSVLIRRNAANYGQRDKILKLAFLVE